SAVNHIREVDVLGFSLRRNILKDDLWDAHRHHRALWLVGALRWLFSPWSHFLGHAYRPVVSNDGIVYTNDRRFTTAYFRGMDRCARGLFQGSQKHVRSGTNPTRIVNSCSRGNGARNSRGGQEAQIKDVGGNSAPAGTLRAPQENARSCMKKAGAHAKRRPEQDLKGHRQ